MENIELFEYHIAIDLITTRKLQPNKQQRIQRDNRCVGAYVLNTKTDKITTFQSKFTVLATGGASKVYLIYQ